MGAKTEKWDGFENCKVVRNSNKLMWLVGILNSLILVCLCVCVCVRACMRVRARASVRACVYVHVHVCVHASACLLEFMFLNM